jgi:hypothetical protein
MFSKGIEKNMNIKEFIKLKEKEPIEEPVIYENEKSACSIINKSNNLLMEEQLVKDEPRRKIKVNIPDPIRRISKEEDMKEKCCLGNTIDRLDVITDDMSGDG